MIQLAFYKGTRRENPQHAQWQDRLICWWTRSRFSHVEFIARWQSSGSAATCWAASNREGQVRVASIDVLNGRWEIVNVPLWDYEAMLEFFVERRGTPYGWLCALAHALPRPLRPLLRWLGGHLPYCSQIIAAARLRPHPWITPQELYELAQRAIASGES